MRERAPQLQVKLRIQHQKLQIPPPFRPLRPWREEFLLFVLSPLRASLPTPCNPQVPSVSKGPARII